ncbi:MAG TPA: cation:proton antiporter [Candidatus Acidoferrales bacterium]|nr:cation:proton antiporter [Candidatus Acidoferrales bacterium]
MCTELIPRPLLASIKVVVAILFLVPSALAMSNASPAPEASPGDPIAPILLTVVFIVFAAFLGGLAMRRLGQPAVLGELLVGMLVANLAYAFHRPILTVLREGPVILDVVNFALTHSVTLQQAAQQLLPHVESSRRIIEILGGSAGIAAVAVYQFVDQLARIAVILLLFLVGLETSLHEMKRLGLLSLAVASVGIVCSWSLSFAVIRWIQPDAGFTANLFIGAIFTATSVAISARVFRDIGVTHRPEARIVLGAAVIDDILGLIILAAASALVVKGFVSPVFIAGVTLRAAGFLIACIALGLWITPIALRRLARYRIPNLYLLFGLGLAFVFAWLANRIGLATIVGAFAAGLVLEDFFKDKAAEGHLLREILSPLEALIVPIYFVLMGMQVKIETFARPTTLWLTAGLAVAAILGKLAAGAVCVRRVRWLAVGVAMIPRGEVELIFASIGRSLGVVNDATFSAVVAVVMITTFIAPPLLKLALRDGSHRAAA